jgi:hypothetical protein
LEKPWPGGLGVQPWAYLQDVLTHLPPTPLATLADLLGAMIRRRDARVQRELKPLFAMTIQVLGEGFIEGVAARRFGEVYGLGGPLQSRIKMRRD